jgi:hypothetical protein
MSKVFTEKDLSIDIVDLDGFPVNKFDYVVLSFGDGRPVKTKFRGVRFYDSNGSFHADFGENNGSLSKKVICKNWVVKLPVYLAYNQYNNKECKTPNGALKVGTKYVL